MYNLILALLTGLSFLGVVWVAIGPLAAIAPAIGASLVAMFLLTRRTGRLVQAELTVVTTRLQQRRIDEAQTKLVQVKQKYGPWQFLLSGQVDAQLGMIDYLQRKFDAAVPKLESGKWRNGPV